MNKNTTIIFKGPMNARAGYGSRSRDLAHVLIDSGYDVKFEFINWGSTPNDVLDPGNLKDKLILDQRVNTPFKPDIYIQCTIPTEFEPKGKFNIGITAGIETDTCHPDWIEGCNKMDLILTSSEHSKKVFQNMEYQKRDRKTDEVVGLLKLVTPVEVLFEGIDPTIFKKLDKSKLADKATTPLYRSLSEIPNDFCFLFVGHWLQGNIGHDRKDIGMLIHTFLNTFKQVKSSKTSVNNLPALILKTSSAGFSTLERYNIEDKIRLIEQGAFDNDPKCIFPPIYFLSGDLTDTEMNDLYNHRKVKASVSFTKGEGFGRPLLEFTTTGKPVIASNWSGQLDFLNPAHAWLLPGKVSKVDMSATNQWIIPDSSWFTVNYQFAAQMLNNCYKNYQTFLAKSEGHIKISEKFSLSNMAKQLNDYIAKSEEYLGSQNKVINKKIILDDLLG